MKKLFSLLLSIAFLLVFVSFFSQKTFATDAQCQAQKGFCSYSTCATGAISGVACDSQYMQCCKPLSVPINGDNGPCVKHFIGGACGGPPPSGEGGGTAGYLYTCANPNPSGIANSKTYCTYGCQVNSGKQDTCKPIGGTTNLDCAGTVGKARGYYCVYQNNAGCEGGGGVPVTSSDGLFACKDNNGTTDSNYQECCKCSAGKTLVNGTCTGGSNPPPPVVNPPPPAPPAPPTCVAKTGDWGTCTGVNACSTTGSRTRTNTNANCTTVNETDSSCALTPPASCNKPTVPSLTCTTATPTTASLSWANGTNTTETVLYYCDRTKAAAHSPAVSCTRDSQATSDSSQAGWYFLPGNAASTSPTDLTGLIVGHEYTSFVRAYNGNHVTSTLYTDSADINFTGGSCASQPGLALVIGLDGIGTTGDQVNADWTTKTNTAIINGQSVTNPVAGSNQTPNTPTRQVTLTLTSNGGTPITVTGNVTFVPSGTNVGKYTGTIPYGTTVNAGTYTVKVTVDGHLTKLVPGTVTVVNVNTTTTIIPVDLVTGDITTINGLSINDYSILLSCISDSDFKDLDAHAVCSQNENYKARADTEDNGVIDKFDYNLFLREFSKIQAGD